MSERSPGAAQRLASDPTASVWVGASAGTGKTRVLTERVLRLMLAGTPPDKILCITFTNAAAAEMANRIRRMLAGWAAADDADLAHGLAELCGERPDGNRQRLARQLFARVLDAPGGLKIHTIHGFCQSLLRRFPLEAGVPPHFRLMDDIDAAELLARVRMQLLEAPPPGLADALAIVTAQAGEGGFSGLMGELTRERGRLARMFERFGGIDGLRQEIYDHVGVSPGETERTLHGAACADAALDLDGLRNAVQALMKGSPTDIERGKGLAAWLDAPHRRIEGFEAYCRHFLTAEGEIRGRLLTAKPRARYPGALEALEAEAGRLCAVLERCRAARVAEATAALFALAEAMIASYEAEKRRRAQLDYDDLILIASRLLHDPGVAWVLYKLDGGIEHVLIDEAQDTSPEQWRVIAALAEEFFAGVGVQDRTRTLFAVGDEKQSIFSFQGADPAEFARMHHHFAARTRAAQQDWRSVALNVSFRSTAAVLTVVDAVFAQPVARDGVGADPAMRIEHLPFRKGDGGLVELWPPIGPREAPEPAPWAPPVAHDPADDPAGRLAVRIAETIRGWLDRREMLESKGRPIRPGDVMVLVRTRTRFFVELVRALKDRDIPVAGVDRMMLTEQIAVMDMMALADFLLLPDDDLTLATVLKGPLIGLSEDQLFTLAHGRPGRLWHALIARAAEDPAFLAARTFLGDLLARVDFVAPYELFAGLLVKPCPADPVSGRRALLGRLGAEAEDPIDEFLSLGLAFERSHPPSLQRFLHWLRTGEVEIKRELDAAQGQVRIMTVHGSKGLQAPIVFLPDMMGVPTKGPAILWPDGPAEVPLWAPRRDHEETRCQAARQRAEQRRGQEYRRLLYVALTRAEDRLYLCGHHGRRRLTEDCWHAMCQPALAALDGIETLHLPGFEAPVLRYSVAQSDKVKGEPPRRDGGPPEPLPAWARRPAPPEPVPTTPLTPSRPESEEPPMLSPLAADADARFVRGRLVHALLQTLPDLDPGRWDEAVRRYLDRPVHRLDPAVRDTIAAETLAILRHPDFAAIFGPGSRAEAPIVGLVAGKALSGQIDRLLVTETEILVVDYKTNRPPPKRAEDVSTVYLRQMAAYRAALRQIYPDRPVHCALLWTDGPRLMTLDAALLDRHAPTS